MNIRLTPKAALVKGVLMHHLAPLLAADSVVDLQKILAGVTAKNYVARKAKIAADVKLACDGKLAADASLDDITHLLDGLDKEKPAGDTDNSGVPPAAKLAKQPQAGEADDEDPAAEDDDADKDDDVRGRVKNFLSTKLSAEDMEACDALWNQDDPLPGGDKPAKDSESDDDDQLKLPAKGKDKKSAKDKKAKDAEPDLKDDDDKVSKKAMDSAIKLATDAAIKAQADIRAAEKAVRPYVGELSMSFDSADKVYQKAFSILGKDVKGVHSSAYPTILAMLPKPGARPAPAADAAFAAASGDAFTKAFPGAAAVKVL